MTPSAVRTDADTEPSAPEAPAVIARSASKTRATIRAVRLTSPLRLDGRLDEEIYTAVSPVSDFIQMEPREGEPATERTEVWVFFDRENVYVVGRCWDSQPQRGVADEMRRDNNRVAFNENFAFSFDTFRDRRTGYNFEVNPLGGRWDGEIGDDGGIVNGSVNPVWEYATGRFDQGWVVEARIPFRSLRYGQDGQPWGFQVRRLVRWKNEISFITHISAAQRQGAHMKVSLSPTLVGLEVPPAAKQLEVRPYAISSLATDTTVQPRVSNRLRGDWGGEAKYAISRTVTADLTYNTDFAQAEADLQQANLTRFSLFFPEKREFFLENSGLFTFGGAMTGLNAAGVDNTPALFYSRRIGLQGSDVVPILGGARVSGRVGRFAVGLLNMETKARPGSGIRATNFSVIRLKRDLFRRSTVGMIATNRYVGQTGTGGNQAYGVDGQFLLTNTTVINTFWARTSTSGRRGDDTSYKAQLDYVGDRYGLLVDHLAVGANFNPEIGFVRHPDLHRSYAQARFSPRPRRSNTTIRKFYYNGTWEYIENGDGRVDTRTGTGEFAIDFQNGDRFNAKYLNTYEFLPNALPLAPGVVIPSGGYHYASSLVGYNLGPARKRGAANLSLESGTFYGGHKTTFNLTGGLVSFPPHLIVEPTYSYNDVELAQGSFTTHLFGPRFTFMATPLMFVSALVQFNSTAHTVSSNIRFRWEYQAGSELFVVWNEQRDTLAHRTSGLQNRALIVKVNRLIRF